MGILMYFYILPAPIRRISTVKCRFIGLDINDFVIKLTIAPSSSANEKWNVSQRRTFLEAGGSGIVYHQAIQI